MLPPQANGIIIKVQLKVILIKRQVDLIALLKVQILAIILRLSIGVVIWPWIKIIKYREQLSAHCTVYPFQVPET